MSDPFGPAALAQALKSAVSNDDTVLPYGKTHALVTMYDGESVSAAYVQKINDVWSFKTAVEWHGGEPQIGLQAHASW